MKKKRNLDMFRFIAALMVVAIHTYPFTIISEEIDYGITRVLFRIAVPFFLMITGYFILPLSLEKKEKLIKYTLKIIKIYIISIFIYLPLNIYNHTFTSWSTVLKAIFIDGTFYHLWYFPALLLGLWITYYLLKIKNKPLKISIFLLLYGFGLLGDSYFGLIKDIPIINSMYQCLFQISSYTRNGIFYAPIFLGIGYRIAIKENKNKNAFSFFCLLLSFLLLIGEGSYLYIKQMPRHNSMYISLIPLSYFLFLLIASSSEHVKRKTRNLATWLYILHPLFIIIIRVLSKIFHIEKLFLEHSMLHYLAVVSLTICFILIVGNIKQWMMKK